MVATIVFTNADARVWYLGRNVRKLLFFSKVTHHKNDVQYPVLIWS